MSQVRPLQPIAIIGMMGSGKSTVGRLVAGRLDLEWWDTDQMVETRAGRSIGEIFATAGEERFRELEHQVLAEALQRGGVISCGGGAIVTAANRALLRDGALCVWLRAPVAVLAERVDDGSGRPLLVDEPEAVLERLLDDRRHHYERVADVVIDVDDLGVDQVAALVVDAALRTSGAR